MPWSRDCHGIAILASNADIAGVRVIGDRFVLGDLRVAAAPVTVPAALPVLLADAGLPGAAGRRRRV